MTTCPSHFTGPTEGEMKVGPTKLRMKGNGIKEWALCLLCCFDGLVWLFIKVVDSINSSTSDARPKVLVSATAVGYYGMGTKL